jgi:hypothetical protein
MWACIKVKKSKSQLGHIFVDKEILLISAFQVFASRKKINLQSSVNKPHNDLAILVRAFYERH